MKRHLLLVVFTFFILWRIEEGKTRNPTAAWIPVSTYTDLAQCQQKSTELVIFVTPYFIDPDSKRNKDMLDYSKKLSQDAEQDMKFSIFD